MNKKLKTIDIKGKEYVPVAERIRFFNEAYENGMIQTELLSSLESSQIVIRAVVTPDVDKPARVFTGYSQEVVGQGMVNKTSALENAETSAVGRALGMMGIGVIESIASADEVNKANNSARNKVFPASEKQIQLLRKLLKENGVSEEEYCKSYQINSLEEVEKMKASRSIEKLMNKEKTVSADDEAGFEHIAESLN